ncbi:MAG: hypothetical protein OXI64_06005 [Defluviicoccus sp.]|nr:hypothetical protein [Defluviicoccus sp.]
MSEFETASLAIREAAMWIAAAHVTVALLVGVGQIGIVYYGIQVMNRMGAQRAKEARKRDKAEKRRHTETMTALQELIRRTAPAQPA